MCDISILFFRLFFLFFLFLFFVVECTWLFLNDLLHIAQEFTSIRDGSNKYLISSTLSCFSWHLSFSSSSWVSRLAACLDSTLWSSSRLAVFVRRKNIKTYFQMFSLDPWTANDELSRHENLTFLWTWTLMWVPRSFATHAALCNTLPSNKLYQKQWKSW